MSKIDEFKKKYMSSQKVEEEEKVSSSPIEEFKKKYNITTKDEADVLGSYKSSSSKVGNRISSDFGLIQNDTAGLSGYEKYLADMDAAKNAANAKEDNRSFWQKAGEIILEASAMAGQSSDTTLPMGTFNATVNALREDQSYRRPNDNWTTRQKSEFGKLYLESPTKAYDYAEKINIQNNKAMEEAQIMGIQKEATSSVGSGIANTIGAIASAPLAGADFLNDLALKSAGRDITPDGNISPFEYSQAVTGGISEHLNEKGGTLDEDIPIIGGKGWGDVYGLGTSIAQSMASAYTLGPAGTLVSYIGQGAAAGVDDALSRGASDEQALLYGAAVGAFEGIAEKMGIDNLFKLGSASTIKGLLKNIANQALAEGSEEGVTSILSNIADAWVLKDKSSFNIAIQDYMSGGMSESDAKWKVFWDSLEGIAFDTIAGAASGSVSGGLRSGVQTALANADAKKNYSGQVEDLLIEAGTTEGTGEAVDKYINKYGEKGKLSGWNINHLLEITDTQKVKSAVEAQLTKLGESGDVSALAEVITKQAQGIELSKKEQAIIDGSKYGQRVVNTLDRENIKSGEYDTGWTKGIGTRRLNADVYNKSAYDLVREAALEAEAAESKPVTENTIPKENATEAKIETSKESKVTIEKDGEKVEVKPQRIASFENGEMSLELEGGEVVSASEVDFGESGIGLVYQAAQDMSSRVGGFNVDTANVFVKGFDPGVGLSAAEYVHGFSDAYRFGKMGVPVSELASGAYTSRLSEEVRNTAYNFGRAFGNEEIAKKSAKIVSTETINAGKDFKKATKKGKVHFDGSVVGKNLTERQKASLKGLSVVAEAMGVDIHIFESSVGKDGKRQGANGWYDPVTKEIHLDLYAGADGNGVMLFTASHELTHHIKEVASAKFKIFADALLEEYVKNGQSVEELIQKKLEVLEANGRLEGKTETEAYDLAYEEVVADACESMLVDSNAIEALSRKINEKDKGLWERIKDFISKLVNRIRAAYKGVDPDSREGKLVREMEYSVERLQKLWVDALLEASDVTAEQTLGESGIIVNSKTDSASLMSVRDVLTDAERKKVSKALAERFGVTQVEAMDWLTAETSLASLILNPKYSQYLDYTPDPNEVAIKQNSDYPQGTVDFSPICAKRREFTSVMNNILRLFPNHVFAATDLAKIRSIMQEEGMTIPCGICYVEDRRQLDTIVAQNFIDSLKLYREGSKTRPDGKPFNTNQLKGLSLIDGDNYTPSIYELVSLEGLNVLKEKNPNMAEAWVKFNNARGMQSVRLLANEAEYKRQILKYTKKTVKAKNDKGGLRVYSFSDAEMFHLIDIVQVITDSATVGLSLQGYTKVNEYARAVKDTGEKLNRSLIPKGELGYHIEDGKVVLDYDTVEGIDINHPDFFDNKDNPNVGNITIGVSDVQIRAAMVSDFVDQIIPFHTGQSDDVLGEKGIATWFNYKDFQTEKDIATGKVSDHQINIYTEVLQVLEKEGKPITKRTFVEKFLQVCKENGLTPRFSQFLNTNEQGEYVYTEGYHKMLVDFKTFAQTEVGEYLPQMPVKPIFDNEYITKVMKDYVKSQKVKDAELAESMPKVIERITNEIVKPGETKYSDRDSQGNELSKEQQKFFKDSKARDVEGNLLVLYHGTSTEQRITTFMTTEAWRTGLWLSTDHASAVHFARATEYVENDPRDDTRLFTNENSAEGTGRQGVYELYANVKNPLIVDAQGKRYWEIPRPSAMGKGDAVSGEEINAFALENGYDGVIIENVVEGSNRLGTDVIVFSPNQVKYTDNLNPTVGKDIRYSDRDVKPITEEEYKSLEKHFGTTGNFKLAGYLLPDGKLLDFSGKHWGNPHPTSRDVDHRDVQEVLDGRGHNGVNAMIDMIGNGSIRLMPEIGGINLAAYPNEKQRRVLSLYIKQMLATEGQVIIDYDNVGGDTVYSRVYEKYASSSQILGDIRNYFNGTRQSDLMQFHTKYSDRTSYAPTFYSHMGKVIDDVKLEKMGTSSILNHLKNRGVKDEEIKWSGIETFLEGKKSVTKAELQEFVAGSQLVIEERNSGINNDAYTELDNLWQENFLSSLEDVFDPEDFDETTVSAQLAFLEENGMEMPSEEIQQRMIVLAHKIGKPTRWEQYKLDGGTNYREIVFKLPNSTYSNRAMRGHWGSEAEGILVHARIQDFNVDGKKMLFIEELQSDWHNEGREKGYTTKEYEDAVESQDKLYNEYKKVDLAFHKYVRSNEFMTDPEDIRKKKHDWLRRKVDTAQKKHLEAEKVVESLKEKGMGDVPDAPFKNNYHEYVLKRLLRMAAEEGYDSIGWTPADIQSKRWSYDYEKAYQIEYDQEMPKFLRKYGKKWGASVGFTNVRTTSYDQSYYDERIAELEGGIEQYRNELKDDNTEEYNNFIHEGIRDLQDTLSDLYKEIGGEKVWSMDITDSMKDSVLYEGQALYQDRGADSYSNRSLLANALETAAQNDIEREKLKQYKAKIDLINSEEQKLHELREQIKELSFKKGPRDTQAIKSLQFEANQAANRINTYDRQLLNLESTKALKGVLEREKALARKRDAQKNKETLERYREKAAETQRELMTRYQESRKRGVESRNKTALRRKIRKVVKDLNNLFKNGNKKRNIKEEMKDTVASSLALADVLFTDDIRNEDIVRLGVDSVTEKESKLLNEYSDLLDTIDALYDKREYFYGTEKVREELLAKIGSVEEQIAKIKNRISYLNDKLSDVFERERARLHKVTIDSIIDELVTEYSRLENSENDYIKNAYNEFMKKRLEALKESLEGKIARDLDVNQLTELYDTFKAIEHMIRHSNSLFREGRTEDLMTYVSNTQGELYEASTEQKDRGIVIDKLASAFNEFSWNNLRPVDAVERLGSKTFEKLFWDFVHAMGVAARDITEAGEVIASARKKYGYSKWRMDLADTTFTTRDGLKFKPSLADKLSIYAYSQRDQAEDHMVDGGFTYDTGITYKETEKGKTYVRRKLSNTYRLSKDDIQTIIASLKQEQRDYVDAILPYLTDMGKKGNEVSMTLYGIELFGEKVYFPLQSSKDYLSSTTQTLGATPTMASLANSGFTKQTKPHAKNPIVLRAFDDVVLEHIEKMSNYHALVIPIENLRRVFDSVGREMEGMPISTKALIGSRFGVEAQKYFEQWLTDINGGVMPSGAKNPIGKLFSKAKGMSVAANLSVVAQQYFSIIRAMEVIAPKYFTPFLYGEARKTDIKQYEELLKYAPIAIVKEMGGFDVGSSGRVKDYIGYEEARKDAKYINKKIDDIAMWGAGQMDKLGWVTIWKAVKAEVASEQKLTPGTEEFYEACRIRFTEVVTKTQVFDSVASRSGYMRSQHDAVKYATSFMGEPTAIVGRYFGAGVKLVRAVKSGNKSRIKSASLHFVRMASVIAVSGVLGNLAKSLVYGGRDDDEDEALLERWARNFAEALKDDLNILNSLPFGRDIVSTIEGWDVERPDMTLIADMVTSAKKMLDGDITFDDSLNLIGSVGNFFGKPLKNVIREIKSAINVFGDITDDLRPTDIGGAFVEGITGDERSKTEMLYNSIMRGDTERVEVIKATYKSESSYESAIRKALRENDPRIKEAAEAKISGDSAESTRIAEEIEREGHFSREDIKAAIKSEINNLTEDDTSADDSTEDKDVAISYYDASDINVAFENGDTALAKEIIADLIDTKVANGKTEKEAKSSLRSSMTSYWKPLYKNTSESERIRIRKILYNSGLYGNADEVIKTVNAWLKD